MFVDPLRDVGPCQAVEAELAVPRHADVVPLPEFFAPRAGVQNEAIVLNDEREGGLHMLVEAFEYEVVVRLDVAEMLDGLNPWMRVGNGRQETNVCELEALGRDLGRPDQSVDIDTV